MVLHHKQVEVFYNDESIAVDVGIADLLQVLWDFGIETKYSCEGTPKYRDQTCWSARPHRGYISMDRTERSMELVRMLISEFPAFKPGRKISWIFDFHKHPQWGDRIVLRFPNSDIPKLTDFIKNTKRS
jgi:hypothetical protein